MSEAEKIDKAERRKRAEARLVRSRPAREAAAAAHAVRLGVPARSSADPESSVDRDGSPKLSNLETKILDAANDVLVSKGGEGRKLAGQVRSFIAARQLP